MGEDTIPKPSSTYLIRQNLYHNLWSGKVNGHGEVGVRLDDGGKARQTET